MAKIFYSWSSDNDPRVCRDLIHFALEECCKRLTAELEEAGREVELDHDTKGTTGTQAITDTIERKIRECDVFVADLTPTYVQQREDGVSRIVPNPNVMYELGYAFSSIGPDRIIVVMNTAFADQARKDATVIHESSMPFNLRHRSFPICYDLDAGATTATLRLVRDRLLQDIQKKIKPLAETPYETEITNFEPHPPLNGCVSTFLQNDELLLDDGFMRVNWRNEPHQTYFRFFPETRLELTKGDFLDLNLERHESVIPPYSTSAGTFGPNRYGFVISGTNHLDDDLVISRNMLQYFRSGEVWAIFSTMLLNDPSRLSHLVENQFAWAATKVMDFMSRAKQSGSGKMIFGIIGLEGRELAYQSSAFGRGPRFDRDEFIYEAKVNLSELKTFRSAVEKAAERLWSEAGASVQKNLRHLKINIGNLYSEIRVSYEALFYCLTAKYWAGFQH